MAAKPGRRRPRACRRCSRAPLRAVRGAATRAPAARAPPTRPPGQAQREPRIELVGHAAHARERGVTQAVRREGREKQADARIRAVLIPQPFCACQLCGDVSRRGRRARDRQRDGGAHLRALATRAASSGCEPQVGEAGDAGAQHFCDREARAIAHEIRAGALRKLSGQRAGRAPPAGARGAQQRVTGAGVRVHQAGQERVVLAQHMGRAARSARAAPRRGRARGCARASTATA